MRVLGGGARWPFSLELRIPRGIDRESRRSR